MKELKEKILTEGVAIGTQIVKVDNFLNHKLDVAFLDRVGKEFHRRFADCEINKIQMCIRDSCRRADGRCVQTGGHRSG